MNRYVLFVPAVLTAAAFATLPPNPPLDTTLTFDVGVEKFQWKPQVAFDGANYFAVWEDSRHDESTVFTIYGARLSAAGVLLDTVGIRIAARDRYDKHTPGVAFDGTNYLVTWQAVNPNVGNQDLYGARVSRDGVVLDPGGFLIASADGHQFFGNVAFNGSQYLVTWLDGRSGVAWLYCARVTTSGRVLDTAGIAICRRDNQNYPGGVAVAGGDSNWMIVADEGGGSSILAAIVKADGSVARVETLSFRTGDSRWFPDVDYDPEDSIFFVAWQDWRSGAPPEGNGIWGCRVTRDGDILDPGGFPIADDPSRYQGVPAVAWNGRYFMVAYIENIGSPTWYDVFGKRILPDGTVVDSASPRHLSAGPYVDGFPDIARAGGEWFVAWEDPRGNMDEGWGTDIYAGRVDSSGNPRDIYPNDKVMSASAPRQFKVKAVARGDEYFAVWQEFRGNRAWDVYAARFDGSGAIIGQPFPVSADSHVVLDPTVSAGDSCLLVAWEDEATQQGQIVGRRIAFDGTPLGPQFVISDGYINRYPTAAFDGEDFMVAYWEGNFPYEARARRVAEDGSMGSEFVVSDIGWRGGPGWNNHTSFGLAFDGTNYLLVWPDWQESESQYEIKGARFTPSGTVLDPDGFFVTRTPGTDEDYPRLVFGNGQYFAVWHDFTAQNVCCGRIDTAGISLDTLGIQISAVSGDQRSPDVAYDGFRYFAAWEDTRSDIGDVYGARISLDGTVLDPNGMELGVTEWRQSRPGVASNRHGSTFVAYSSFIDTVYSASRLQALTLWTTGIELPPGVSAVRSAVSGCLPNPFSHTTAFSYSLATPTRVSFAVYDVSGRRVRRLRSACQPAGAYSVTWNGRDDAGVGLPAGVYSIRGNLGDTGYGEEIRLVR